MEANIFEKLKAGEPVNMFDQEYNIAVKHLRETILLCYRINHTEPDLENLRPLFEKMLCCSLDKDVFIMPPVQIDFGRQVKIGSHVVINHGFNCMSAGGVVIEDGVQIGPSVSVITTNHDFENHNILRCKGVRIAKNAWIGACSVIMPGVHIGENAVVAGGAVVTKDVPANVIVGGNPAKIIRYLK